METLQEKAQATTEKKQEVIGIHAKAILSKNIANEQEINKWMDAVCMDEDITKGILGEEIFEATKPQLQVKKSFLDEENQAEILALPEFQKFFKQYTLNQEKAQQTNEQKKELEAKNVVMAEMDMPEDLKEIKEKINNTKINIREILDEKQEKNEWSRKTFWDIIRKSSLDEAEKKKKSDQIYDFIFDHMEASGNRKKRKTGETSTEFYKRIGVDYMISEVRKALQEAERKMSEKISKWKSKAKEKIKIPKQEKQEKRDYTQEAIIAFRKNIKEIASIRQRFYFPEEKEDMKRIQAYMKKNMQTTIPSPDMKSLQKDSNLQPHMIKKEGTMIKIHPLDYVEIERRKMEYKKRFLMNDRNAREYLFDRLVEYIGKDILAYKIQSNIEKNTTYKGTTFMIEKTDPLDDTSAGADYIVTYDIPGKQKERIAAIDLFISEKSGGKDIEEETDDKRKQKNESAKKEKIPYSTYLNLFPDKKEDRYTMEPLKRYVDQQDPTLVYTVLTETLRNKKANIGKFLQSYETKWELYALMRSRSEKEKEMMGGQFHQNILTELEKIAA